MYTSDGRDVEMSVASTKAFYAQVAAGALLSCAIAEAAGLGGRLRLERHELDAVEPPADRGLVIVNDRVDGYTTMSQATIGLQLGGQKYAQFIFFRDTVALGHFRRGNFEFGAQASAVAITAGASSDAAYDQGVAIFTQAAGGLMLEGTVGGQRFTYEPASP